MGSTTSHMVSSVQHFWSDLNGKLYKNWYLRACGMTLHTLM